MSIPRKIILLVFACLLLAAPAIGTAAERFYREATYKRGELKYRDGLPVLIVEGTPEEIGRQKAALTAEVAKKLAGYPKRLMKMLGREDRWPKLVEKGRALLRHLPPDHLKELKTFAEKSGIGQDAGVVGNTMIDMYRGGFGCSSLIVEPKRSATKGPLFGRNLDFFGLGVLDRYNLVTVHRPKGKHAFVSIGFPGMFGCLSGMNDAGLAVAVHEVFLSKDGSPMFNPKGTPYAFIFRRMLEECTTVEEAEKLLRATRRTTLLSLAVCDRGGGAVLEMTPRNVVLRRGEDGICACTNRFRTRKLAVFPWCHRYARLMKSKDLKTINLAQVAKKLDEVNQGRLTMQTMIFEPVPLNLHLAIGSCPSSKLPLKRLELGPLFQPQK